MIRVLLDQGIPSSLAERLRARGWDALHVFEIGMSRARDQEILELAAKETRIVVTLDADFHTLLAISNASGPSVIRFRQEGLRSADLEARLLAVWPRIQQQLENGCAVTITAESTRLRRLPLVSKTPSE